MEGNTFGGKKKQSKEEKKKRKIEIKIEFQAFQEQELCEMLYLINTLITF